MTRNEEVFRQRVRRLLNWLEGGDEAVEREYDDAVADERHVSDDEIRQYLITITRDALGCVSAEEEAASWLPKREPRFRVQRMYVNGVRWEVVRNDDHHILKVFYGEHTRAEADAYAAELEANADCAEREAHDERQEDLLR